MDSLQKPEDFAFISDRIELSTAHIALDAGIKKFQLEVAQLANNDDDDEHNDQDIYNPCYLVQKEAEEARKRAGVEYGLSEHCTLRTNLNRKRDLQLRKDKLSFRQTANQIARYRRIDFAAMHPAQQTTTANSPEDIVLKVVMMKPYNKPLERHQIRLGRLMLMDSAFLVLGRNRLSDLHDCVKCIANHALHTDISAMDPADVDYLPTAADRYRSAFFFIEDTFYDLDTVSDTTEKVESLSTPIVEWCERNERLSSSFSQLSMTKCTFSELSLRLGRPYLYCHQLTCEHLFVVTDISLRHSHYPDELEKYPICVSKPIQNRTLCIACGHLAQYMIRDSDRIISEPSFWCSSCNEAFNYDTNGNKIGDFKLFLYPNRRCLI